MRRQRYPEPTVGIFILNSEGKLLLLQSHKWPGMYVVPGGHVELGESVEVVAIREAKEETGLDVYDLQFLCWQEFVYGDAFWKHRHFIFFDYSCRCKTTNVILNDEAESYSWIDPRIALGLPMDAYMRYSLDKMLRNVVS